MMLTIIVGGVSGLMSYIGYVLAAPDLQAIVNGKDPDPIPAILESSLGTAGSKIFLVHCDHGIHLVCAVIAGRGKPADLRLRPGPDAAR